MTTFRNLEDLLNHFKDLDSLAYNAFLERHSDKIFFQRIAARSEALNTGTFRPIWPSSSDITLQATEQFINVVSSSVNDTAAGTGARTVRIVGVDGNYTLLNETVTLNGTTPVQTVNKFLVINEINVRETGSSYFNEGTISATSDGDASLQALVYAEESVSKSSLFATPADYTGIILRSGASCYRTPGGTGGAKRAVVRYKVAFGTTGTRISVADLGLGTEGTGMWDSNLNIPIRTGPGSIVYSEAIAESGSTSVATFSDIIFLKDSTFAGNFTVW